MPPQFSPRAHFRRLRRATAARHYNFERYRYQGIGRYEPEEAYGRGIADIEVLAKLVPDSGFAFGLKPTSCDATIYGFTANIYFYAIETPLKRELMGHPNLVRHCLAVHSLLEQSPRVTGATE